MSGPSHDQFTQEDLQSASALPLLSHDADYLATFSGVASLGMLRSAYERRERTQAKKQLQRRMSVNYASLAIPSTDTDALVWDIDRHYLDMMVAISASVGLWAAMPNVVDRKSVV